MRPLLRGRFGKVYRYAEVTPSTQRMLGEDSVEGAVAVTEEQTEGRGRLGRQLGGGAGHEHPRLRPARPRGRAAPSARALTRRRRRRRAGDRRGHRDRAGDQVSERPADRHAQGRGDPGRVERRPRRARDRRERQPDRAGASGRHAHPADVTTRGARRTGRPRAPARSDPACSSSATTTPGLREPQRPAEVAGCVAGDDADTAHARRAEREHSGTHGARRRAFRSRRAGWSRARSRGSAARGKKAHAASEPRCRCGTTSCAPRCRDRSSRSAQRRTCRPSDRTAFQDTDSTPTWRSAE